MDVEKLIQAAEWCKNAKGKPALCPGCQMYDIEPECLLMEESMIDVILTIKFRYEHLLKAEKTNVIAYVMNIISENTIEILDASHHIRSVVETSDLINILSEV